MASNTARPTHPQPHTEIIGYPLPVHTTTHGAEQPHTRPRRHRLRAHAREHKITLETLCELMHIAPIGALVARRWSRWLCPADHFAWPIRHPTTGTTRCRRIRLGFINVAGKMPRQGHGRNRRPHRASNHISMGLSRAQESRSRRFAPRRCAQTPLQRLFLPSRDRLERLPHRGEPSGSTEFARSSR